MVNYSTVKRLRAVILALAITLATNYAISYAAKASGQAPVHSEPSNQSLSRSGMQMPPPPPIKG